MFNSTSQMVYIKNVFAGVGPENYEFLAQLLPHGSVVMAIDNHYQSPNPESPANLPSVAQSRTKGLYYSPEYNTAFKTAILNQTALAAITLLVLDFGQTHRAFWIAFLCQWAMVLIILLRRAMHPSWFDLILVRYGIVPLLFIVAVAGPGFLHLYFYYILYE